MSHAAALRAKWAPNRLLALGRLGVVVPVKQRAAAYHKFPDIPHLCVGGWGSRSWGLRPPSQQLEPVAQCGS